MNEYNKIKSNLNEYLREKYPSDLKKKKRYQNL